MVRVHCWVCIIHIMQWIYVWWINICRVAAFVENPLFSVKKGGSFHNFLPAGWWCDLSSLLRAWIMFALYACVMNYSAGLCHSFLSALHDSLLPRSSSSFPSSWACKPCFSNCSSGLDSPFCVSSWLEMAEFMHLCAQSALYMRYVPCCSNKRPILRLVREKTWK